MTRTTWLAWRFAGTPLLALAFASLAWAAEPQKGPPKFAFPPAFDEAEFRRQVAAFLSEESVTALRIGYFMRRVRHALEGEKALSILQEELAKEGRGTARWFALQSVYAFGHIRTDAHHKEKGHEAYRELFRCAASGASRETRLVGAAAADYLATVQSGNLGMVNYPEVEDVVVEALPALAEWWIAADDSPAGEELPMPSAVKKAGPTVGKAMVKAVERCLPHGAEKRTYARLKRAAICVEAEAPEKAVEYLKEAEHLIPAGDKEEAFRLYTRLAGVLAKLKDYDAALATQQRCIQRTGRGLAGVGRAHLARGDKDEVRKVLESLMSPGSNEEDVLDLARDLAAAREGGMAIELLGAYLTVERPRDPVCELEARFLAGQVYALRRRRQEAVEVLAVEHLEKHLRTTAQRLSYKNALALRASLAQQAPEEPKVK